LVFQSLPFLLPVYTAHFEDVVEVGSECHAERHEQRREPVIDERELFIADIVPKELDVEGTACPGYGNAVWAERRDC
jgi:hypothetical protein